MAESDDRAKDCALNRVGWVLQGMMANLLRVSRGAGAPGLIVGQANEIVQACIQYREAAGYWPRPHDLAEMLSIDALYPLDRFEADTLDRLQAERHVIKGVLQLTASHILSQWPQVRAGEAEMYRGIDRIHKQRKEASKVEATRAPLTPAEIGRSIRARNKFK